MDIRKQLLQEHSKANTLHIVDWIESDSARFEELMALFLGDEYRLVQRSAWVVGELGMRHPSLFTPYLSQLLAALREPLHPAVRRNGLKFIAESDLRFPEEEEGLLVDLAFDLLADPKEAIAIRVHAMQVIVNLCKPYPELGLELKPLLTDLLDAGSAGLRSRAKRSWTQLFNT